MEKAALEQLVAQQIIKRGKDVVRMTPADAKQQNERKEAAVQAFKLVRNRSTELRSRTQKIETREYRQVPHQNLKN